MKHPLSTMAATLALCAASIAPAARAQTVAERAPSAPVAEPAERAAEPDELDPPVVPEASEELRARVATLAGVVAQTEECFTNTSVRALHMADARCGSWYATLLRGGSASARAIGALLERAGGTRENPLPLGEGEDQRGPRLVQVLVATGAPEAAPYMLRLLSDARRKHERVTDTEHEVLRQLPRVTGDDPMPVAPWERGALGDDEVALRVTVAWLRWWRAHEADTPAQRAAAAESHALADLASDDGAVRFSAIQRLASAPAHRAEAAAALRDLLARRDLPARASVYIRRWALRARMPR